MKITEMAEVIRSKNVGPYELTFDIIFKSSDFFKRAVKSGVITKELISKLYNIPVEDVLVIVNFEVGRAIKITITRPIISGNVGETDTYGCQQHVPLYNINIP